MLQKVEDFGVGLHGDEDRFGRSDASTMIVLRTLAHENTTGAPEFSAEAQQREDMDGVVLVQPLSRNNQSGRHYVYRLARRTSPNSSALDSAESDLFVKEHER